MNQAFAMIHTPMHALGNLRPAALIADTSSHISEGEAVINGVDLPQQVIEELRKLGIALSWYNAGELHDAINATHFDGQLVDDHHGVNFRDKLHHTEEEKEADEQSWYKHARMRVRNRKRKHQSQHCQDDTRKPEENCGYHGLL